jgi:small subunit ribosomal protein S16
MKGRREKTAYRLVVIESKNRRDGRAVEHLGYYNPNARGKQPRFGINVERVQHWLSVGAQATDTVKNLIRQARRLPQGEAEASPVVIAPVAATA